MPCVRTGNMIVCFNHIYRYEGFLFEWHNYCGPMKLKKDESPAKVMGRKFYAAASRWRKLPKREREKYNVSNEGKEHSR